MVAVAADAPAEASDDDVSLISFAHTNSNSLSNFGASSSSSNLQHMTQPGRRYRYATAGVDMLTHIMSVKASLSQWEVPAFGFAGVAWYFALLKSDADMCADSLHISSTLDVPMMCLLPSSYRR